MMKSNDYYDDINNVTENLSISKLNSFVHELNVNNMLSMLNDSHTLKYNLSEQTSNSSAQSTDDSYSPELWVKVFWSCLFSLMVITAFVGNSGVIMIVLLNKQMRTVTNFFIGTYF